MKIVDRDGHFRAYRDDTLVAEKHPGHGWRNAPGDHAESMLEPVDPKLLAQLEAAPVTERVKVRDGTKPMPPGTYWDFDRGHYVEPDDEEWSADRRQQQLDRKRRERQDKAHRGGKR